MEKWRGWLCFKHSVLFPTKCILVKVTMLLRRKAKAGKGKLLLLFFFFSPYAVQPADCIYMFRKRWDCIIISDVPQGIGRDC